MCLYKRSYLWTYKKALLNSTLYRHRNVFHTSCNFILYKFPCKTLVCVVLLELLYTHFPVKNALTDASLYRPTEVPLQTFSVKSVTGLSKKLLRRGSLERFILRSSVYVHKSTLLDVSRYRPVGILVQTILCLCVEEHVWRRFFVKAYRRVSKHRSNLASKMGGGGEPKQPWALETSKSGVRKMGRFV